MKKLRILIPTVMAASLVPLVSMVGCKDNGGDEPEVVQHTITWKCDVDTAVSEINPQSTVVDDGVSFADIKTPEIKWNKGFARDGNDWYSDKLCQNPIDGGTIITSDMDIYVKSKELQAFALTWNCSPSGSAQITKPGETEVYEGTKFKDIIKAEFKENEGYKRSDDKWYSDMECKHEIKPEDAINKKTDIYAKFAKVWNVTWTANLPAGIKEIKPSGPTIVDDGTLFGNIDKPQYILNDGYRYVSGCEGKWYSDSTCLTEITATTPINADTKIYINLEATPVCTITWKASPEEGAQIEGESTTGVYEGTLLKDITPPTYIPQGEYKRADDKWYSDADCQTEIKPTDPITSDMDIYAKFALIKTITWKANLEDAIESIEPVTTTFAKGTTLKEIDKPVFDLNEGYNRVDDFWYSDKACTLPINPRGQIETDMEIYAKFELTPSAETISINEGHEATATLGYNLPFACTIKPRTTTQKAITWSSSNQSVATIDSSGVLTPLATGTTTVRAAITDNTNIYDECLVTVQENTPLCFEKDPTSATDPTIKYHIEGQLSNIDIEYKINDEPWTDWPLQSESADSTELTIKSDDTLLVRNNVPYLSSNYGKYFNFVMTGKVYASGNVNSLINNSTTAVQGCFFSLFLGCASLTTAPSLPSSILNASCYQRMFEGCSGLISAPELPSLEIPQYGYYSMFKNCKSLKNAPELPTPSLSDSYVYEYMFEGCTSLENAPALPATHLTLSCYYGMFYDCTSLKTAPELPATNLAEDCYLLMFYNCKQLTIANEQSEKAHKFFTMVDWEGTDLESPARKMFDGCKGVTEYPIFGKTYYWVETE